VIRSSGPGSRERARDGAHNLHKLPSTNAIVSLQMKAPLEGRGWTPT
jgi:hypothetical protein